MLQTDGWVLIVGDQNSSKINDTSVISKKQYREFFFFFLIFMRAVLGGHNGARVHVRTDHSIRMMIFFFFSFLFLKFMYEVHVDRPAACRE